jgi:hypothetical protein
MKTAQEFIDLSGITIDELVTCINYGVIFPMVAIESGIVVRRIPSLLTESIASRISNDRIVPDSIDDHSAFLGYDAYCQDIREYSNDKRLFIESQGLAPPDTVMPMPTDITYTSGDFVYIEPDSFMEAMRSGVGRVRKFICPDMGRNGKFKLYRQNLDDDEKRKSDCSVPDAFSLRPSIRNRFVKVLYFNERFTPVMCYPDDESSLHYLVYLAKRFPVSIWMATKYLDIFPGGRVNLKKWVGYGRLEEMIDEKLNVIVHKPSLTHADIAGLVEISAHSDQWIPAFPDQDVIRFDLNSIRFSPEQIKVAVELHKNGIMQMDYHGMTADNRYFIRKNHIQKEFIYQLFQFIEKQVDSETKTNLENIIKNVIGVTYNDLLNDDAFTTINALTGGSQWTKQGEGGTFDSFGASLTNFGEEIRGIGKENSGRYCEPTNDSGGSPIKGKRKNTKGARASDKDKSMMRPVMPKKDPLFEIMDKAFSDKQEKE